MRKDKSGKIIVSLTEVKNKTGDVFALVDQFGVVFLTSYNKIRYKIEKVGISNLFENIQNDSSSDEFQDSKSEHDNASHNNNKMDIIKIPFEPPDPNIESEYIKNITQPLI